MNYIEIRTALDEAVALVNGIPAINTENMLNKPAANVPFTRTTFLPSRPTQLTVGLGGKDQLIGLMQVDLYFPMGAGADAATEAADALIAAFPRTWKASIGADEVMVTQSWLEAGRVVNNWYTVAVILAWSSIR